MNSYILVSLFSVLFITFRLKFFKMCRQVSILSFKVFIFSMIFLIWRSYAIQSFKSYVDTSTISTNASYIYTTLLVQDGKFAYVSVKDHTNSYVIIKYNLTQGNLTYINKYVDPYNSFGADGLMIFNNTYLITTCSTNLKYNIFGLTNFSYIKNSTISNYIYSLKQVSTKQIVLFFTKNGKVGYVTFNNFLNGASFTYIAQTFNSMAYFKYSVSSNEQFLAVGTTSDTYIKIFSLINFTLIANYTTNSGVGAITWKNDNQVVLISTLSNGKLHSFNLNSLSNTVNQVLTANNYMTYDIQYYPQTNQAFIAAYVFSNLNILSFNSQNLTNYSNNYFLSITLSNEMTELSYCEGNNLYLTFNNQNSLYFKKVTIQNCSLDQIYNQTSGYCVSNISNVTNEANGTNNTTTNNITNSSMSNITQNNTSFLNTSTNSTNVNNITNQTNSSFFNNSSNNSSINETISQKSSNIILSTEEIDQFKSFSLYSFQNPLLMQKLNKIPGGRRLLSPLFSFFSNFDDIWLYNYHKREYDDIVTSVFNSTRQMQTEKWGLVPLNKIYDFLNLNYNSTQNQFNLKANFTSWRFLKIQKNANGFMQNTLNFFFSNLILMLIIFIACKIIFRFLFNYQVSIFLRPYSTWFYFILMIFDGNIQYFTYLFTFELMNFFNKDYINKFALAVVTIIFFAMLSFSVILYPLLRYFNKQMVKYFLQNMNELKQTAIYFSVQIGLRNVLLGLFHYMFQNSYFIKIGILIFLETFFLIFTVLLISSRKCFKNQIKIWINLIATFLRIVLIFTFFLDVNNIQTVIQYVHLIIFYLYILLMLFSIFYECTRVLIEFISFLFNKGQNQKQVKFNKWANIFGNLKSKKKQPLKVCFVLDQQQKNYPTYNKKTPLNITYIPGDVDGDHTPQILKKQQKSFIQISKNVANMNYKKVLKIKTTKKNSLKNNHLQITQIKKSQLKKNQTQELEKKISLQSSVQADRLTNFAKS